MRILVIGDPHGDLSNIKRISLKDIDFILITGDIGKADLMRKYAFSYVGKPESWTHYESPKRVRRACQEAFSSSIGLLRFLTKKAPVYFVYGNVENSDADTKKLSRNIGINLPLLGETLKGIKNVYSINNKKVDVHGISLAGLEYFVETDWVRRFAPNDNERMKAAEKETARAKMFLGNLPYVDILLCHQPPFGVLDKVTAEFSPKKWQGKHAGSKLVLSYVKRKHPEYVFCGHIHEGKGMRRIGKTKVYNLGEAEHKIISLD